MWGEGNRGDRGSGGTGGGREGGREGRIKSDVAAIFSHLPKKLIFWVPFARTTGRRSPASGRLAVSANGAPSTAATAPGGGSCSAALVMATIRSASRRTCGAPVAAVHHLGFGEVRRRWRRKQDSILTQIGRLCPAVAVRSHKI